MKLHEVLEKPDELPFIWKIVSNYVDANKPVRIDLKDADKPPHISQRLDATGMITAVRQGAVSAETGVISDKKTIGDEDTYPVVIVSMDGMRPGYKPERRNFEIVILNDYSEAMTLKPLDGVLTVVWKK
jgi:hypothetical protein